MTQRQVDKLAEVLQAFFARQSKTVLSRINAGAERWWDQERWDSEAGFDDLHATALAVTGVLGKSEASALGFTEDDYAPEATVNYLRAVVERYADNINTTTKGQLDAAVADPDGDPATVFTQATESRAPNVAAGMGTFLAGFATNEAASQIGRVHDVEPTKTWITGTNPRGIPARRHEQGDRAADRRLTFSNGLSWPRRGRRGRRGLRGLQLLGRHQPVEPSREAVMHKSWPASVKAVGTDAGLAEGQFRATGQRVQQRRLHRRHGHARGVHQHPRQLG